MRKDLSLLLVLALAGCGENEETTSPVGQFGPPENMKALSVNSSTVGLQWTAPTGQPDSLGGYVVQWGNKRDTLGKSAVSFLADSLTHGEMTFTVYSRRVSGTLSDGTVIKWAPADRFNASFDLFEYKSNAPTVQSALDVGTASLSPSTMPVDAANASRMDFLLFGGTGQVAEALELRSASMLTAGWNTTMFSTVSHPSGGLDYYLAAFPAAASFTLDHVPVTDNTIFYAKVVGDNGGTNYARIFVHLKSGPSFPSRAVEVRVSLQRVPGLLYARREDAGALPRGLLALIMPSGAKP